MARSPGRPVRNPLSTDRIEEAALELIERDGLEGFSTRKLAAELGCEAMSIYHYYPSKAHLFDALFDRIIGGLPPDNPALSLRQRLEVAVLAYREMAHRYPRFFPFIALHRHNTRTGLAWLEGTLAIFRDAGLDDERAGRFFRVVSYYVVGGALDETSGYANAQGAVDPVPDDEAGETYPLVTAVNRYFKPEAHEATFRLGLDALLDRVEEAAREAGRKSRPAKSSIKPRVPPSRS